VTETDPQILEELRKPVSVEWEYGINAQYVSENKEEFDAMLEGRRSKLVSFDPKSREVMAMAVRNVLGLPKSQISDEAALLKVLDPVQNPLLADVFETGIVDPLSQTAEMVNFVFADIISHAGDSQRQRHRTTPGATAPLESLFDGTMDSFVPMIVKENPELSERFLEITKKIVENVNRCIDSGMPKTAALSLLPNSQNIRLVESGNLLNRIHRMKSRLCLNAQEEIFFNDLEQARQIVEVFPETRKVLRAPCGLRKDIGEKPPCPEGKRYCGQRMWMEPIENYQLKRVL
ncbi:MAG TPA: FAD-dependent thymidylate synthase, partial [Patescibacteria group bacterium]